MGGLGCLVFLVLFLGYSDESGGGGVLKPKGVLWVEWRDDILKLHDLGIFMRLESYGRLECGGNTRNLRENEST